MTDAIYRIVEHDGGWAYKLGDVFSETFPSKSAATDAAERVAAEQRVAGEDEEISWQDEAGLWHNEVEPGNVRPNSYVEQVRPEWVDEPALSRSPTENLIDHVRGVYDRGDEYARRGLRIARSQARGQPLVYLMLAGLCGYALAALLHKRS